MKWITRARPKTDRIACPWLIRRFIDPDAEILYVPPDEVLAVARARGRAQLRRPRRRVRPPRRHVHVRGPHRRLPPRRRSGPDPPGPIVHAADIDDDLHTDPLGPGLLAIGLGGLDVEADDHRLLERASFVYDALYAWCARQVAAARHDRAPRLRDIRADAVRQVAKLMAAAAITAPKSGGQLFLAGQTPFMETVIVDDPDTLHELADWMRARGKERRERSGSATPTSPKPSMPSCSSGSPAGTHPTTTAAPAATRPAPSSSTPPRRCATTQPSSSSPARPATCATSTSASPSAPPPRPPRCTPSTAAARPASRSPPASSASSRPTSPSASRCR